ncbi:conserved hypothetical protein [Theileria orientalis strain Shintoku]|uniref:Uncharacterized protein n=1 Tax=Theileria orientalis strain Shintoku TaxID=869250 RepID=J4C3G7_THEOR|nr:conserved hypothetical protein [Theileria orientalis strain Shintoku]BAM40411.1 conserved hypothetical protein [Theileria orientalis strain Shintoku]|eukprot:XP_009690712.1 conserved hypothetical protein [Theileria orientalis strain Shintoku]
MFQNKSDCDQYIVTIGLMKASEHLLGEDVANIDLVIAKERLMTRILNFNNHISRVWTIAERANALEGNRSISQRFSDIMGLSRCGSLKDKRYVQPHCRMVQGLSPQASLESDFSLTAGSILPFDAINFNSLSRKASTVNKIKVLNRDEFFVYSASLTFNPTVRTAADLLTPCEKGRVVFTVNAKMPTDARQRKIYSKMMVQFLGSDASLLDVKSDSSCLNSPLRNAKDTRGNLSDASTSKPIPKYFDEYYSDEDDLAFDRKFNPDPNYSFLHHNTYILSKYLNTGMLMNKDHKYFDQRLLQVKLLKSMRAST